MCSILIYLSNNGNDTAVNLDDLCVSIRRVVLAILAYNAMYPSSYVAGKLWIWKERGQKRLTGLLAKKRYVDCYSFIEIAF